MNRKSKFLSLFLAMAMIFSMAITASADELVSSNTGAEDLTGSIIILHTNDVHGAIDGYAKAAAMKQTYEEMGAYVLLMDAGDFIQGSTSVSLSMGETAVELMNLSGYDVSAIGNHEFDYGYANLTQLESQAEFPFLAANVLYNGALAFQDNMTFTAPDGTKIGVFGLSTPETATKAHPAKIQGVTFLAGQQMYDCAQQQVNALTAAGCDIIVCLGHLGIDEESVGNRSTDLLEHVTGIDLFIDGHSHSTLEEIKAATNDTCMVGDTVLTSTGTQLANVGVVTISDGVMVSMTVDTESVTVSNETVAARAAAINAAVETEYGATFATSEVDLNGARDPGNRTEETNLGDLICDAILWYATKDGGLDVPDSNVIALTNGGGIRASIAAGDITKQDVNTVLPFGNTVAVIYITGSQLLEALEASTYCTPTAIGGFPQVAGIEFTVNTAMAFDQGEQYPGSTYYSPASINRVTITSVNGQPFDANATYAVVTNDFTAAGGDTYYAFSIATVMDTGAPLDEALMQYITEELNGTVPASKYAQPAGRITVVNEPAETPVEPTTPAEPDEPAQPDDSTIYVVVKGDSLWKIAKNRLGDGTRWGEIFEANRDTVKNANRIYIGQELIIPAK